MRVTSLNYYLLLQGKEKGSLIRIGDGGEFKYNNFTGSWEDSDVMDNFYAEQENDTSGDVWGRIHAFRKKITEEDAMKIVATANKEIAKDKWQNREMQEELDSYSLVNGNPNWSDEDDEDDIVEMAASFEIEDIESDYGYDEIDVHSIPAPANILDELFWSTSTQRKEDYYGNEINNLPKHEPIAKPWLNKEIIFEEPNSTFAETKADTSKELGELKSYLDTRFNSWFASVFYRNATNDLKDANDADAVIRRHYRHAVKKYQAANEANQDGFIAYKLTNDGLMSVSNLARQIAKTLYYNPSDEKPCRFKKAEKIAATVKTQYEQATAWLLEVFVETDVTAQELLTAGIPEKVVAAVLLLTKVDNISYEKYLEAIKTNKVATAVKIALLKQEMNLTQVAGITADDMAAQRKHLADLETLLNVNDKTPSS